MPEEEARLGYRSARQARRRSAKRRKRLLLAAVALLLLGVPTMASYLLLRAERKPPPPPQPVVVARLTVPEGFTVGQIARRAGECGLFTAEDFIAAASAGDYGVSILPEEQASNLEGLLFPKTYDLYEGMRPRDLVQRMLDQFSAETVSVGLDGAERQGITPYQAVIVASLIEREAVVDEERPLIAAVIYNRLRAKMLLQIDATVQYALPEWKEVLTYEDLKVDSPYNTYRHGGLPPAPICNPGLNSIIAALQPASVDYLYYVATGEGGRHFFTADYQEFLRAKEKAQKK